ncbi:hypothetical protein NL524_29270, partial [Klebsiella pneumoniae]|nr:hypothetical protein [Klebsiella pneumoniae]
MKATIVDNVLPDTVDRLKVTELNRAVVAQSSTNNAYPNPATGPNVVVVDFGLKHSILRELAKRQCNLTVLPYNTTASEIMALNPDGVMLTNGP